MEYLSASETTDALAAVVRDLGSVAAALAAIAGVVWAVVTLALRKIQSMIDAATKPLFTNGGKGLADMPQKIDDISKRLELLEERQMIMKAILIERRNEHRRTDKRLPPSGGHG